MRKLLLAAALCLATAGLCGAAEITLRFGFETPRTDSQYIGAKYMADMIAKKSNGRVEIKLFPDSVLGPTQAMISQVRGGTLDMYMGGSSNYANFVTKLNIFDILYLFRGPKHVDAVLDSPLARTLLDELDAHDMKGLAFWENGFRCLTNSKREVRTAADAKGLKVRVQSNPMHILAWELLGANPIPMPLAELFTALETGAVEAQEHALNITYSAKLYEVQKWISVSNHAYGALLVSINDKKFASLPKEVQDLLIECAVEAGKYQRNYVRENIAGMVEKMKDYGCIVTPADQMDNQSFFNVVSEKARAYYLEKYGGEDGAKWLKQIDDMAVDG